MVPCNGQAVVRWWPSVRRSAGQRWDVQLLWCALHFTECE